MREGDAAAALEELRQLVPDVDVTALRAQGVLVFEKYKDTTLVVARSISEHSAGAGLRIAKLVSTAVTAFGDLLLAVSLLFLFLAMEEDPLELAMRPLLGRHEATLVCRAVEGSIAAVIGAQAKMIIFHFFGSNLIAISLMWLVPGIELHMVVTIAALAAAVSVVPCVPAALVTGLGYGLQVLPASGVAAAATVVVSQVAFSQFATQVYEEMDALPPSLTLLAIIGGVSHYGPGGALIGPILVTTITTLYAYYTI